MKILNNRGENHRNSKQLLNNLARAKFLDKIKQYMDYQYNTIICIHLKVNCENVFNHTMYCTRNLAHKRTWRLKVIKEDSPSRGKGSIDTPPAFR